jgi:hypothetical protein
MLKKFDIAKVKSDNTVLVIGKRATGKSFLVRDLLSYHQDLPVGTVISTKEQVDEFYTKMIPEKFIHAECTTNLIEKFRIRQDNISKTRRNDVGFYGKSLIDPRAFLVLDNCFFDRYWVKDNNMKYLIFNNRQIYLFLIITMSYPMTIPPNIKANMDFVFIFRENSQSSRKLIYESYAHMFSSFEVFSQVMDQFTQNYDCLVIDNTSTSTEIEDVVFWYNASDHDNFLMCDREYWTSEH